MVILRILLLPLAGLYNFITGLRNRLFDLGLKPSVAFDLPVISVGNLSIGGTGKSPMIEHLVRLLRDRYTVAILSRGYGRKTKGVRIANSHDNALTLGDEPFQFYRKFSPEVVVAVGEERAMTIPTIMDQFPDTGVILLDDAFQHRTVRPTFNILLTDYNKPFYKDFVLPAGRLRESRNGATRADAIIITKCPAKVSDDEMMEIEKEIRRYSTNRVFYTRIRYGIPLAFGNKSSSIAENVILVSGIANHQPLENYVKANYKLVDHIVFKDHHNYSRTDLERIVQITKEQSDISILTTEKDMVKLDSPDFTSIVSNAPFFYLPIEVEFLKGGRDFDEMVQSIFKTRD